MAYWYLSFVNEANVFLGATLAVADSAEDALTRATELELNPGGDVLILGPLDDSGDDIGPLIQRMLPERLLSFEEMISLGLDPALVQLP